MGGRITHSQFADVEPRTQPKTPKMLLVGKDAVPTFKAVSSKFSKESSAGHPFVHIHICVHEHICARARAHTRVRAHTHTHTHTHTEWELIPSEGLLV